MHLICNNISQRSRCRKNMRADILKMNASEASALADAERKEREKWQGVIANMDAALAEQAMLIEELRVRLGEKE